MLGNEVFKPLQLVLRLLAFLLKACSYPQLSRVLKSILKINWYYEDINLANVFVC